MCCFTNQNKEFHYSIFIHMHHYILFSSSRLQTSDGSPSQTYLLSAYYLYHTVPFLYCLPSIKSLILSSHGRFSRFVTYTLTHVSYHTHNFRIRFYVWMETYTITFFFSPTCLFSLNIVFRHWNISPKLLWHFGMTVKD